MRGNHEFVGMNRSMGSCGFEVACSSLYKVHGPRIFQSFHETFAYLPLSARVGESILILHGGNSSFHMHFPLIVQVNLMKLT